MTKRRKNKKEEKEKITDKQKKIQSTEYIFIHYGCAVIYIMVGTFLITRNTSVFVIAGIILLIVGAYDWLKAGYALHARRIQKKKDAAKTKSKK